MTNLPRSSVAVFYIICSLAMLLAGGCTSRSKARAEAERAFYAGQQQGAWAEIAQKNGIIFTGPVRLHVIPWTEGLTLSQAIVAAHFLGQRDPQLIIVSNGTERAEFTPRELLDGMDFLLQSGDVVELVP